jgi:hypothetical protein
MFICPKCNLNIKTSRQKHVNSCNGTGTRRKGTYHQKIGTGQNWAKGKSYEELYGIEKANLKKQKISKSLKGKSTGICAEPNKEILRREKIRNAINKRYENGWEVKCGRCKKINYHSEIAGDIKLDGSWELLVAKYLDSQNVNWIRNKKRFQYINLQNKISTYCPDFYINDWNTYLEIKGYETKLDKCKWSQFNENLLIWRKKDLKEKQII